MNTQPVVNEHGPGPGRPEAPYAPLELDDAVRARMALQQPVQFLAEYYDYDVPLRRAVLLNDQAG